MSIKGQPVSYCHQKKLDHGDGTKTQCKMALASHGLFVCVLVLCGLYTGWNVQYTHPHTPDHSPTAPSRSVDKLSPMRLVNLVKGNKGEETLAEINRKMQRALEEACTHEEHSSTQSQCVGREHCD